MGFINQKITLLHIQQKAVMSIEIADLTSPEVIELTDLEIRQIIGGASASGSGSGSGADFSAKLGELKEMVMLVEAQQRNIEMRALTTKERS